MTSNKISLQLNFRLFTLQREYSCYLFYYRKIFEWVEYIYNFHFVNKRGTFTVPLVLLSGRKITTGKYIQCQNRRNFPGASPTGILFDQILPETFSGGYCFVLEGAKIQEYLPKFLAPFFWSLDQLRSRVCPSVSTFIRASRFFSETFHYFFLKLYS